MKKVFSFMFVLCICVALMSVATFAATQTYSPASDGTYSVSYLDGNSGNYYALLVVDGIYEEGAAPTISEDTVLYIDQAKADENGDISFVGWIPKNENPATVYLGSTALSDGPVLLGYLGSNTFVVSGTVTSESVYEATVTLTDADNKTFTATSVDGAYSVDVPEGTYTFTVNVKNHLSYTQNNFVVNAEVSGKDISVLGGDLNGDGVINEVDLGQLRSTYGDATDVTDITGDVNVNEVDLGIVMANYGEENAAE